MDVAADHTSNSVLTPQPAPVVGTEVSAELGPQSAELRTKILARIVVQTRPAPLPKPWAFLRSTQSTCQLSIAPGDVVAALQSEFSLAELFAARIVEQDPHREPRLSPVFGDPTTSFVIRRDANDSPIDATSARGSVTGSFSEWVRLAGERAGVSVHGEQPVLLASTDDEALAFHLFGLPFVSGAGLKNLDGQQVRELFGARPPRREQRKHKLTIPGWQIGACIYEPAPRTIKALRHIAQIKSHFPYDPGSVFDVWLPSTIEFHAICSARTFADRRVVVAALRKSLICSRYTPADALRLIGDRAEPSYGDARAKLEHLVDSSHLVPRAGEMAVALAKFENAFKKSVVTPLLAADDDSPWDRWRSLMAGELAKTWFGTLGIKIAAQNVMAGQYPGRREIVDERLLNDQLRIANALVKLNRPKPPG